LSLPHREKAGGYWAQRFGDLNRASVVSGFTRARRKTPVEPFNRNARLRASPQMKNLQPILFTVAVVVGTLVLIFRFAPIGIRKVIVGA